MSVCTAIQLLPVYYYIFINIAPLSWKLGVITCLLYRAYLYSSNHLLLKTKINFINSLLKRNGYSISFFLNVIHKSNKFSNHNQRSPADSPTIHPYIGTPSIKFGKRIAALFRDRLGTDIKIAGQTFKIISYFKLKFSLPLFFFLECVHQYTVL